MGGEVLRRVLFPAEGCLARGAEGDCEPRHQAAVQRGARVSGAAFQAEEIRRSAESRRAHWSRGRPTTSMTRMPFKTRILTLVVILTNVLGNFALSFGMNARALATSPTFLNYASAFFSPVVL